MFDGSSYKWGEGIKLGSNFGVVGKHMPLFPNKLFDLLIIPFMIIRPNIVDRRILPACPFNPVFIPGMLWGGESPHKCVKSPKIACFKLIVFKMPTKLTKICLSPLGELITLHQAPYSQYSFAPDPLGMLAALPHYLAGSISQYWFPQGQGGEE